MVALVPRRLGASRPDVGCGTTATPGPPGEQGKESNRALKRGPQSDSKKAERISKYHCTLFATWK